MQREVITAPGLWMLAFPPSELGVVAVENKPGSPNSVAPVRVNEALTQFPDLVAVVDGSQFGIGSDQHGGYAGSQRDVVFYRHLDVAAGIDIPASSPGHASQGASISVVGGVAHYFRKDQFVAGATVGIQSYPNVIYDGRVDVFRLGYSTYMSGVGLLEDGRCFVALGHFDIPEFGAAVRAKGAKYMGYGDGGGSGGRAYRKPDGTIEFSGNAEHRRVATLYACVDHSSPDGRGGIAKPSGGGSGGGRILLGAVAVAALGVGGALAWDQRRAIMQAIRP